MALTKIPTHMLFSGAASEDLSIDADTLYIDSSTNRVGIANNSPSVALDVTGAAKISSTLDLTSHLDMPDSANVKLGTGDDLLLYHDGTNSYIANTTGALKIATETSGIAVTIGHTTSETTVADNLTVTGTITGTLATAAQTNITSLGTLTGLTVNGATVFNENSADVDFRVESNGNADMLFVDGGNDNILLGTQNQGHIRLNQQLGLAVSGNVYGGISFVTHSSNASGNRTLLDFNRSRNDTIGSHTVVNSGDALGTIVFRGDDGDEFLDACYIQAEVDGTPGNGDMPGRLAFYTTADGSDSSTERMRIDSSGRMIIGHTASIDNGSHARMQVYHSGSSAHVAIGRWGASSSPPFLTFVKSRHTDVGSNTIVQDGDNLGKIRWRPADGNDFESEAASIYARVDGTPGQDDMPGELYFATTNDGGSTAVTRMVINSSGNVGIGTSSPSLALEVNDTANVDGEQISIKGHADYGGTVVFRRGDSYNWRVGVGGGSSTNSTIPSSYLGFEDGNSLKMCIAHTTGNVGIGHTSPSTRLYVHNSGGGSSDCMTVQSGSTANSNVGMILFRDNDGDYCGQITTNGSTNTAIYNANTSDERLKENITDWDIDALALFKNIEPKEFNFKSQDEGAPKVRGYIAQTEVSKFPEAFTTDSSEEAYYSYNPSGMVIYLMKALKEQVAINEALEARIKTLEDA
jgi:hypothetical protein